jgi:hypothetical protein
MTNGYLSNNNLDREKMMKMLPQDHISLPPGQCSGDGWRLHQKTSCDTMLGIIWTELMIILRPNGDYIEYMRQTLDYNITLIPFTIIPLTIVTHPKSSKKPIQKLVRCPTFFFSYLPIVIGHLTAYCQVKSS